MRGGGTWAGPQERTGGSGVAGHILKVQCYSRHEESMFPRDQDKTGTEFREGQASHC